MKKILLLTLLICQTVVMLAADNWVKVGNLWYWYNDAKTEANLVTAQNDDTAYSSSLSGAITIPKNITVDETTIPVTEIRKEVFANCTNITSSMQSLRPFWMDVSKVVPGCKASLFPLL